MKHIAWDLYKHVKKHVKSEQGTHGSPAPKVSKNTGIPMPQTNTKAYAAFKIYAWILPWGLNEETDALAMTLPAIHSKPKVKEENILVF